MFSDLSIVSSFSWFPPLLSVYTIFNRVIPNLFFVYFVFSNKHFIFSTNICENVHEVYGARILTHDLQDMSLLPQPLDHGSHPFAQLCTGSIFFKEFGILQSHALAFKMIIFCSFPTTILSQNYYTIFPISVTKLGYFWKVFPIRMTKLGYFWKIMTRNVLTWVPKYLVTFLAMLKITLLK